MEGAARIDSEGSGPQSMEMPAESIARLQARYARAVRPMALSDVDAVAQIHATALPDYFLTSLGHEFLALYYREVVGSKLGISLVFVRDGRVVGFVTGEFRPGTFYRQLFLRRWFAFGFRILAAVVRRPGILLRIARELGHRVEAPRGRDVARLASLAVLPEVEGRGYGLALVAAAITHVRRCGGTSILLEVKQENQALIDAYRRIGFKLAGAIAKSPTETLIEMTYALPKVAEGDNARGEA
ncbi:MAG TPA: GNAT family N-acetyltransferase [Terriglobia bacterium]|nr:GNAT family N-acetyltransferase [Terriglobia bacterium]